MKLFLLVFTVLSSLTVAYCQTKKENSFRIEIDTLSRTTDSTFAKILSYRNDTLFEEKTGFLFPESLRVPRFRLTGNLFKHSIYAIRVVSHGRTIEYTEDNKKKITNYDHDVETSTLYFDKDNKVISQKEYTGDKLNIVCTSKQKTYIITGQNK